MLGEIENHTVPQNRANEQTLDLPAEEWMSLRMTACRFCCSQDQVADASCPRGPGVGIENSALSLIYICTNISK